MTAVTLKQDLGCPTALAPDKWDWIYFHDFHWLALKKFKLLVLNFGVLAFQLYPVPDGWVLVLLSASLCRGCFWRRCECCCSSSSFSRVMSPFIVSAWLFASASSQALLYWEEPGWKATPESFRVGWNFLKDVVCMVPKSSVKGFCCLCSALGQL